MSSLKGQARHLLLLAALSLLSGCPVLLMAQSAADCLGCHNDPSLSTTRKGKAVSLHVDGRKFASSVHGALECVACHEGFDPAALPHAKSIKHVVCQSCHTDATFERYKLSVHGVPKDGKPAAACSDCHSTHEIRKLSEASPQDRKAYAETVCAKCHATNDAQYRTSAHGVALAAGVAGAPSCFDCHDEHEVKAPSDTAATTSRRNVAAMCLKCHRDDPQVRASVGPSSAFIASYENSIHAHAVKSGREEAATCIDCHGAHTLKKGSDPTSMVSRNNIARTCGGCHLDVAGQYKTSIHGTAFAAGVTGAATCTDCHGEHNILSPKDENSPVSARNVSSQVCSPCHASVKLTQKYGLASDRFQSFSDSYHGLADKAGSVEVANCASCHGVHDIKRSSDPDSRVNKANLARTCGKCHPGANVNFTRGSVHVIAADGSDRLLYFISSTYIVLIIVLVGGMAGHNLLDFYRKSANKLAERRGFGVHRTASHRLYLRMSLNERIQHATLLISFLTLVTTGFALRFPDAWWVVPIRNLSPLMFDIRGIAHRIAAVVMVLTSLYHCYYIFAVPRGKQLIRDLLPAPRDLADAAGVMLYNLGFRKVKPKLDRFSYVEKAEYWALVWGTVVMAATGAILWFDNTFLGLLSKLWWDAARAVHYYEAWLATLAIVVWHIYFVIFNPDSYPINLAFWKGTVTEEEMIEEHPLELEKIKAREEAEREAGSPEDPRA